MLARKYLFPHVIEMNYQAGRRLGVNIYLIDGGSEFLLIDIGYMDLDGSGTEPQPARLAAGVGTGSSESDFYTTLRGRVGYALDWNGNWLLYVTGGAIGVNYHTRFKAVEDNICGIDASRTDFDWGYTVGGGIERRLGCHWSIKAEYLYVDVGDDSKIANPVPTIPTFTTRYNWDHQFHTVTAGLNFKF